MVKHNAIEIRRRRTALSLSRFGPDFPENRVRCLSVRIFPVSILSAVRIMDKSCPLSVCPAGQGRDRAIRTLTVLVRRRLIEIRISWRINVTF